MIEPVIVNPSARNLIDTLNAVIEEVNNPTSVGGGGSTISVGNYNGDITVIDPQEGDYAFDTFDGSIKLYKRGPSFWSLLTIFKTRELGYVNYSPTQNSECLLPLRRSEANIIAYDAGTLARMPLSNNMRTATRVLTGEGFAGFYSAMGEDTFIADVGVTKAIEFEVDLPIISGGDTSTGFAVRCGITGTSQEFHGVINVKNNGTISVTGAGSGSGTFNTFTPTSRKIFIVVLFSDTSTSVRYGVPGSGLSILMTRNLSNVGINYLPIVTVYEQGIPVNCIGKEVKITVNSANDQRNYQGNPDVFGDTSLNTPPYLTVGVLYNILTKAQVHGTDFNSNDIGIIGNDGKLKKISNKW